MLVGAGQSALTGQELLAKMLDRFLIRVQLSDSDVEVVTREVLLQKKPSARSEVEKLLSRDAGEVSRQLQDTKIGRAHHRPGHHRGRLPVAARSSSFLGGMLSPRWMP